MPSRCGVPSSTTCCCRNCAAKGARVYEGARVTAVDFGDLARTVDTVVHLQLEDGSRQEWRTRFVVDASGRDTFLADRFAIKRRNRKHASAAIFGHFRNARRNPGSAEGNITIVWFEHGWFWFIPLKDGTTSVGAVCWPAYLKSRKTDLTTFFMQTIAMAPEIADRLKDAELTAPVTATGNYSYYGDAHGAAPATSWSAMPGPSSTRCSRAASTSR